MSGLTADKVVSLITGFPLLKDSELDFHTHKPEIMGAISLTIFSVSIEHDYENNNCNILGALHEFLCFIFLRITNLYLNNAMLIPNLQILTQDSDDNTSTT